MVKNKNHWQRLSVVLLSWALLPWAFASQARAQEESEPNLPTEDAVPDPQEAEAPPPPPPPPQAEPDAEPAANAAKPNAKPSVGNNAVPSAVVTIPASKGSAGVPAGQELVNIDFPEQTEIKDIIKAVALWTGKNVILDRNVNGKVQIISPRKVTKEEAYQAFLSALNLLGLTTVETGKVIKIMPVRTAVKGNLKTFLGSSWTPMTDEIITQIVPLKYIDAKEIQSTLSRIVASNSMIAYQPTNTLIISDSGYKVRRILDILELLDVQGQQAQVAIVPIRYAEAKSIADKVSEIFKNTSATKKGAGASGYRSYKILTDERTNSVIIFGPPRTIADVKALVRKFDIPLEDASRQATIHVRPLDYADARKLASTLSALASGAGSKNQVRRPPVTNTQLPGAPGAPLPLAVADLGDNLKIAPDESSNSLLITGSNIAYQTINSIIRKLDIRRSQVFVEADILDVNMGSGFRFGTSIFGGRGAPGGNSVATTWEAGPLGPLVAAQASQNANAATAQSAQQIEKVASVFAEDMTIGIISGKDVEVAGLGRFRPGALIKLIKSDENTRILASPHILTSDNEESQFVVGEKIFFTSKEITPQTGAIANKVEKEDVDLTLSIKPNVSHSNHVTLQINLESNSVQGIDPTSGLPRVNKRKTKQIVTVKNNQTVVISGLVRNQEFESYKKIPLLGDIPIIGWLFRNSSIQTARSNLMIFLTPHIIHGADDLAAVYKAKVEERDAFLATVYGSNFKDDDFYDKLPSLEDGKYTEDDMDRAERSRREDLLKQLYDKSGMSYGDPIEQPQKPQNSGMEESQTYVPLAPSDGDGGGVMDAGGGADVSDLPASPEPPPPPPPPAGEAGDGE